MGDYFGRTLVLDWFALCRFLWIKLKTLNEQDIKTLTCFTQNSWHFSESWPHRCHEWLYRFLVSLATSSTVKAAVQQLLSLKAWQALKSLVSGDGEDLWYSPAMHLSSLATQKTNWRNKQTNRTDFAMSTGWCLQKHWQNTELRRRHARTR